MCNLFPVKLSPTPARSSTMTFALAFWILMLLWLILWFYPVGGPHAPNVVLFILLLLLGWRVFGTPIHG
jgi:hypothetical protein